MRTFCFVCLSILLMAAGSAKADDRHAGYYYPVPASVEEYPARAPILDGNTRQRRRDFVSGIVQQIAEEPYPPTYSIFAKGAASEKLIVVAVRDGFYDTIFRARALFAALTALARSTALFEEFDDEDRFTFFDLCYMLGFEQITISDGRNFAHQVELVTPSVKAE
ncbi:MAG TPA: molybdopterin-guanine dinucleotide biosynthesis protein A [Alphaproteobacteria bacterium]|nr:molybdopterin-guanine dinucleotide biosynthesis protein A [Alphaproteobacteria bacterium]